MPLKPASILPTSDPLAEGPEGASSAISKEILSQEERTNQGIFLEATA